MTTAKNKSEFRADGLGVSPGIGIGFVHIREVGLADVPEYTITKKKIDDELERLSDALVKTRRQIGRLKSKANSVAGAAGEELGYLLEASMQMLKDSRLTRGAEKRIRDHRVNAEAAVQQEMLDIARQFHAMDDAFMASRLDDIRDVGNRLIRTLEKKTAGPGLGITPGSIIVADELTPAEAALLDPKSIAGIATELGGAQGHTAIMARALGIPAVLGAHNLLAIAEPGDSFVLDGETGEIIINPSADTVEIYARRETERLEITRGLTRLRKIPAVTKDGCDVLLEANVELPVEMSMVRHAGASGIGLLRTEFMFMNRETPPNEDEQYKTLRDIIKAAPADGMVTVRTLDIGGDKQAAGILGAMGESASSPLGLRGIRVSLARIALLETQFKAIIRASQHGKVRILLPMVSSVIEVRRARDILKRGHAKLKRKGAAIPDEPPSLGVMIEVPGAALAADALARVSDFFAIGTNDLTQYTLAVDRSDETVAHLYEPLHPAVLRLIQFSAQAALRARIPISICGEMAGDPRYTALLLGLGIRELSMVASAIPRVKQRIRDLELEAATRRAIAIMDQADSNRIAALLDDFNLGY